MTNVALGPRVLGVRRRDLDEPVERSLQQAYLREDVNDRLKAPPVHLSGGQQREDVMRALKDEYTLVVVTENMQQASRTSDCTVFMLAGEDCIELMVESVSLVMRGSRYTFLDALADASAG